ncbi:MAG: glycosyltransferase [Candidatus Omnitrophica bacterium]|nr:glycosyltransferase [Candidatus Omnitrophota bacterium]
MGISVIVPSYNTPQEFIDNLYNSLLTQTFNEYEVLIIDDYSTLKPDYSIPDTRFNIIYQPYHSGPAKCRNIGVQLAKNDILFFTDSDCELAPETLEVVYKNIQENDITAGNTITKVKTFLGKTIAYLGFPGGGIIGFDQVWKVDRLGFTRSFSSCNVAMKKKIFYSIGPFDTTFPVPGGEDTVFASHAIQAGYKIRYLPNQVVYHVERNSLKAFIQWQITRGRGNYHIKKRLGRVNPFFKLRLWSFKNSIFKSEIYFVPFVLILIILSVFFQIKGYRIEKRRNEKRP